MLLAGYSAVPPPVLTVFTCICTDFNECMNDSDNICSEDENATCANTDGSYSCECTVGLTWEGFTCIGEARQLHYYLFVYFYK